MIDSFDWEVVKWLIMMISITTLFNFYMLAKIEKKLGELRICSEEATE